MVTDGFFAPNKVKGSGTTTTERKTCPAKNAVQPQSQNTAVGKEAEKLIQFPATGSSHSGSARREVDARCCGETNSFKKVLEQDEAFLKQMHLYKSCCSGQPMALGHSQRRVMQSMCDTAKPGLCTRTRGNKRKRKKNADAIRTGYLRMHTHTYRHLQTSSLAFFNFSFASQKLGGCLERV